MSYAEDFSTTAVGSLPVNWAGDTGSLNVQATPIAGSSKSLQSSVDGAAIHKVYYSPNDAVGGDGTFVANFFGNSIGVFLFRLSSASGSAYNAYGLQFWGDPNQGGVYLDRSIAGSNSAGGGGNVAKVVNPGAAGTIDFNVLYTATIVARGNAFTVQVQRGTDSQYLTSAGAWQTAPVNAITATDNSTSAILGTGQFGFLEYSGNSQQFNFGPLAISPLAVSAALGTPTVTAGSNASACTAAGFTGNAVTWASSNPAVATIDASGVPHGVASGSCAFVASGVANSTQTATTGTFTVTAVTTTATSFSASGPASGFVQLASGNFSYTPNASYTGTITPTMTGLAGSWTPASMTWSGDASTKSAKFTATATGPGTASGSASPSITAPSPLTFTSAARTLAVSPTSLSTSSSTTVTLTGAGTRWTVNAPSFGTPSLAGSSFGAVTVVSDTSSTLSVATGSASGSITFNDSTTGATASVTVALTVDVPSRGYFGSGYSSTDGYSCTAAISSISGTTLTSVATGRPTVESAPGTGVWALTFPGLPGTNYLVVYTVTNGTITQTDTDLVQAPAIVSSPSSPATPSGLSLAALQAELDARALVRASALNVNVTSMAGPAVAGLVSQIAAAPMNLGPAGLDAIQVEPGVNARQSLSPILAASAGVVSGASASSAGSTILIKGGNSMTTRITAATDAIGNRTIVTLNLPT